MKLDFSLSITLIIGLIFLLLFISSYLYFFYPKQKMPKGITVDIQTPNSEKYRNDCLHPCIRYIASGFLGHKWWMVQSPYYGRSSALENPILYYSEDEVEPINWTPIAIVRETPSKGYNSDPNIYFEDGKLWVFWRECFTPLCDKIGALMATVGVYTLDGKSFSEPQVFLSHKEPNHDTEQSPILIKRENKYLFYAVHYQYKPVRKNIGVAIWESTSLDAPNFKQIRTTSVPLTFTVDKFKQKKFLGKLLFIPKPLKHDIWHFDLIEHKNKLYMLSVAEWGDNIMLSISDDYINFKTHRIPLLNVHVSQQFCFYKPTGFIKNDMLYVFYTARGQVDKQKNELYFSKKSFDFK